MQRKEAVIEKLKQICSEYSDILGVVILFGSFSRGDATETSDIDLYIEPLDAGMTTMKLGCNKRYKEFKYSLYNNFSNEFDLVGYGGKRDISAMRRSPLWKQIEKDGIVIYEQRSEAV